MAILLVLLVHQAASLVHVYLQPLPTVDVDSSGFQYFARTGEGRLMSMFYIQMLHSIYSLFGSSQYLGCQVSQIAFSLALLALVHLVFLLEGDSQAASIVLVFGLLPSCVLNTSVTMREPFQMCAFLTLAYSLLHLRIRGLSAVSFLIPVSALGLVLFHNGFAVFVVLVVPLSLLWAFGSRPQFLIGGLGLSFLLLSFYGGDIWELMEDRSQAFQRITGEEGLDYVDKYATQVMEGRSDFGVTLSVSSLGGFLRTAPVVTVYYLFSPLPWQIESALDVAGFFESVLRLVLFWMALKGIRSTSGETRKEKLFLLAFFLSLELMWAAGTANIGTAVRHRVVAWGLLVVLGVRGWHSAKGKQKLDRYAGEQKTSIRRRRRELREKGSQGEGLKTRRLKLLNRGRSREGQNPSK